MGERVRREFRVDIDDDCTISIDIESSSDALTRVQLTRLVSELRELADTIASMDGPDG